MKKGIVLVLLATMSTVLSEFALTKENLQSGKLVADSESSQKVGLYCVHRGLTTGTMMVLMEKNREIVRATIPITTTYSSPKPAAEWLTVVWNDEGTAVAIHDSSAANSKVLVYRLLRDGSFAKIALPNLGGTIAKRLKINLREAKASGESPSKWVKEKVVRVNFRFLMKDGKRFNSNEEITFDSEWKFEPG